MKVPPEMLRKITSMSLLLSAIDMPMIIPIGAMIENIERKSKISFKVYPVLANATPREMAAADL